MNKIKTFYNTKRVQKILISVLAIVVLISGIAFAINHKSTLPKTDVSIMLASKDIKTETKADVKVIVNVDIEIDKEKEIVENVSMTINKPTVLNTQLESGEYVIHMTSSPIESDGSTYKIPNKIDSIMVSESDAKDGKPVEVTVSLERIAVEEMTKEQLEIVIEKISKESPDENKELIESLKKRQETAVSDKSSIKDMQQDATVEDNTPKDDTPAKPESKPENKPVDKPSTGGGSGSGSGNSGSGNSGSGSVPDKHTHNWTPRVVNHPAEPAQGYTETIPAVTQEVVYIIYSDGCKLEKRNSNDETASMMSNHNRTHGMFNYRVAGETVIITPESSRWVETAAAKPAWSETVGYVCSCGATK